jgi:predicted dehydrogenase
MSPYRAAILGCTDRGRMHAQAYQHVERGSLVACCDRHAEKRQAFADEFGLKAYADLEEMIRMEKPDLIHLVTAPITRVEQMKLVSELGVPACIVEKPIALEVRDWKALQELSHRTKTKFGVGAQFRYHPDLAHCREALQSGVLGALRFIDCSAVGTICDQGVHVLDWAMSLNDDLPVKRVFGAASGKENLSHPVHPSPDTTVAQLVFDNDVYGLWNLGETAPRVVDEPVYYKHCRIAAYAEKGHILYEEFGRWEIVSIQGIESGHADLRGWRKGNHLAQAGLTSGMFDWLEDDTKPVGTNLLRSLQQWNVVLGLYASTIWRVPVELPFEPPEDLWSQLNAALQ